MKKIIPLFVFAFVFDSASAAVPLHWTVETSRATPAQFEAYQGETLALEAALQSYGKPLEAPSNYSLYWQTNGMGSAWWSVPCTVPSRPSATGAGETCRGGRDSTVSNVLFATWSPTNDVGAKVYNCFIGKPGTIYHAAFQLRLRPSPGALPNELPLPQKVIDFAKVTVLNPPWSGGGGGGVDTNAVIDIIHDTVSGSARSLPKYLHERYFDDSYPEAAEEYYRSRGNGKTDGGCSSVRDGGFLYRNFDYPFDERAEFVIRMSAGPAIEQSNNPNNRTIRHRFASVGIAQVGTNLTEQMVTSGKPEYSRFYRWLPGATVDGINENGVACNINVVDGEVDPDEWTGAGNLHPFAAVRWVLDNATNALHAAKYLKENIKWPQGWTQNFHWMICDESSTYIVENGDYHSVTGRAVMTNFPLYPAAVFGSGWERYQLLTNTTANITNAWYTRAYSDDTEWLSEFSDREEMNAVKIAWDNGKGKESHRGQHIGDKWWWQTVHTSIYDMTNRVLRICVQESGDWYTFAVPSRPSATGADSYTRSETDAKLSGKRDKDDLAVYEKVGVGNVWTWHSEDSSLQRCLNERMTTLYFDIGNYGWDTAFILEFEGVTYEHTMGVFIGKYDDWKLPTITVEKSTGGNSTAYATRAHEFRPVTGEFLAKVSQLAGKANKRVPSSSGNIATLDENGDLADSGKTVADIDAKLTATNGADSVFWDTENRRLVFRFPGLYNNPDYEAYIGEDSLEGQESGYELFFSGCSRWAREVYSEVGDQEHTIYSDDGHIGQWYDFEKGKFYAYEDDIPVISASDPTFTNAVIQTMKDVTPSSPNLRVYDSVRQCWWVLEMVNGVPTWTVED